MEGEKESQASSVWSLIGGGGWIPPLQKSPPQLETKLINRQCHPGIPNIKYFKRLRNTELWDKPWPQHGIESLDSTFFSGTQLHSVLLW